MGNWDELLRARCAAQWAAEDARADAGGATEPSLVEASLAAIDAAVAVLHEERARADATGTRPEPSWFLYATVRVNGREPCAPQTTVCF